MRKEFPKSEWDSLLNLDIVETLPTFIPIPQTDDAKKTGRFLIFSPQ